MFYKGPAQQAEKMRKKGKEEEYSKRKQNEEKRHLKERGFMPNLSGRDKGK